jgi:Zn finger protein HypA/HybF involved in hydrogenase expression
MGYVVATARCPRCELTYEDVYFEDDVDRFLPCPTCQQRNRLEPGQRINGICSHCQKPMDDHINGGCPK